MVKILSFLRLIAKFLAVLLLGVNPIETLVQSNSPKFVVRVPDIMTVRVKKVPVLDYLSKWLFNVI